MDDPGHEREAQASQDLPTHALPHREPPGSEEKVPKSMPLLLSPEPWQGVDESGKTATLSHQTQPEELLVVQAKQGDEEAFRSLIERYEQTIHRYIHRLLGDNEIARDITQETFFKAWQSLPMHDPKRTMNFRPWLYRIAFTTTMDYLRKHRLEHLLDPYEHIPKQASWTQTVENGLCQRETILAVLNQVYPQYRQCLLMRFVGGHTFQEIAQELKISEVTARSYISYGRKQFIKAYLLEISTHSDRSDILREEGGKHWHRRT